MKLLLLSATPFEITPTKTWLEENFIARSPTRFEKGKLRVDILISGVGLPATAFSLGYVLGGQRYDLAIQAGIGGALDESLKIGEVVEVIAERLADLGAEDQDGSFLDLQQLGLLERESGVFTASGQLLNENSMQGGTGLKKVRGLSVNKATGSAESIRQLKARYPEAQVESMEGASFFLAGLSTKVAMLQLRAISNYVIPRDRESWDIPLAIEHLNEVLVGLLEAFVAADKE